MDHIEQVKLNNAILWVEKSTSTLDIAINSAYIKNNVDIDNEKNILEIRHTFNQFLPLKKIWFLKLHNEMLVMIKMVYVTLMVIRHSIFNQDNDWKKHNKPKSIQTA
ncbi:Uncharacterized protein FWK35_00024679 [Aphis craccivora]|uniref:Uncharacterized protein n=1 Tax=Aphis craccivora TaxID=307492 RepID=A0A6G0VZ31_APHCR|nr:Uncharacterized protein FWK35_00024679 [Aphis craccivora]